MRAHRLVGLIIKGSDSGCTPALVLSGFLIMLAAWCGAVLISAGIALILIETSDAGPRKSVPRTASLGVGFVCIGVLLVVVGAFSR